MQQVQNKKLIKKLIKTLYIKLSGVLNIALKESDILQLSTRKVEELLEPANSEIASAIGESQTKCDISAIIKSIDNAEIEVYKIKRLGENAESQELADVANKFIGLSVATKFYIKAL